MGHFCKATWSAVSCGHDGDTQQMDYKIDKLFSQSLSKNMKLAQRQSVGDLFKMFN